MVMVAGLSVTIAVVLSVMTGRLAAHFGRELAFLHLLL